MAQKSTILILIFVAFFSLTLVNGLGGGKVGGRTKVQDVKNNQEVQELGRYSVKQYNLGQQRHSHRSNGDGGELTFTEVVEAEKQVVSGIKYYLKVVATTASGVPKTFDAVVVVKPWEHNSKQLLNFSPSPSPPTK